MNETELVKAVLDYLHIKHIYAWRNNTGAFVATYGDTKRFHRYGKKGSADILGITKQGKFLAIECKVGKNKPRPEQQEFLDAINENGGVAFVARNLNDVIAHL